MKYRIAMWGAAGFLVAGCWALYAFARVNPITSGDAVLYALARFTQPVVFVSAYFHFGVHFYWVLLANATTYALMGWIAEILRQRLTPLH